MLDNREDTTEIISTLKTMYLKLEKAREKMDRNKIKIQFKNIIENILL